MAVSIPSWLDETFLTFAVLQEANSTDVTVEVLSFSVFPAVTAGNNYLGHLFRVPVLYKEGKEQKSTSLIIKMPLKSGFLVELLDSGVFEKEPRVYMDLLPMMREKIQYEFGPQSFRNPLENVLVLKDLKADGYIMCDRIKRLDYDHCKAVMVNIAKFHATSVACYQENPDLIQSVGKEVVFTDTAVYDENDEKENLKYWVDTVVEIVEKQNGCKASVNFLVESTEELLNREVILQMFKPKQNGLNVLNHGDLWINNILFKHDEAENVLDVKFIDYQLGRYASPAFDVIHFIWTSANEDVWETKVKSLIDTYIETLNLTLEKLGCVERINAHELDEDFKAVKNYGFLLMFHFLPFLVCEVENCINMEEISIKGSLAQENLKKLYKGEHYKKIISKVLKQYYSWISSLGH